ncbi:hypothetical protein [Antarcticimicrobium sediminis]|uniref:Uncharacterized protein n=1 Tax=Antarcticimicrobium sediminis TaxID=2546227 RepID=A0A4R5F0I2_9RHOB|nr:hypothetical protein [Antarcticimicrobium sediminis]TDE40978.1 hypothetical protein E1B25_01835 [Antarcticimicrobium sediminis]
MAAKTAQDLVNSPLVQKYIETIEKDALAGLKTAKTVLASSSVKYYSSTTLSTYKADYTRLDKCQGDFNAAWNKVVFGKAKDSKDLIKTYSKYVLALTVLEEANSKHEAMMTAGFAALAATLLSLLADWIKEMHKRCKALEKELTALHKLLKKAKNEVTEAKWQTGLNVAVTAVSFCLGPVSWGARIGVALGGVVVHSVIDGALGPSSGSPLGTANTVAGESVDLADKLSKGSRKLTGAASAVISLKMDTDEIGQAEKIVKEVRKRLNAVATEYDRLARATATWKTDIAKVEKQADAALSAYRSQVKKYKSHEKERQGLLKEFKQWK